MYWQTEAGHQIGIYKSYINHKYKLEIVKPIHKITKKMFEHRSVVSINIHKLDPFYLHPPTHWLVHSYIYIY